MGGAIAEGNMTPAAEFNIWADPEAAQIVFDAELDVTMIGLDVTHKAVTGPDVQKRLRDAGSVGVFVAELVDFFTVYHRQTYGWDGAPIHDAVAVAHVLRPGLVETKLRNVEVELASDLCRGRTVVDLWLRTGRPANAHVGVDLDSDAFFDLLIERIGRLERRRDRCATSWSSSRSRPARGTSTSSTPRPATSCSTAACSPRCRIRRTTGSSKGRWGRTATRWMRSASSASRRSPDAGSRRASSASST